MDFGIQAASALFLGRGSARIREQSSGLQRAFNILEDSKGTLSSQSQAYKAADISAKRGWAKQSSEQATMTARSAFSAPPKRGFQVASSLDSLAAEMGSEAIKLAKAGDLEGAMALQAEAMKVRTEAVTVRREAARKELAQLEREQRMAEQAAKDKKAAEEARRLREDAERAAIKRAEFEARMQESRANSKDNDAAREKQLIEEARGKTAFARIKNAAIISADALKGNGFNPAIAAMGPSMAELSAKVSAWQATQPTSHVHTLGSSAMISYTTPSARTSHIAFVA
ncbi:MAG: hypothetical protein Q4G30_09380 [Actinomycetaceae bacterium]|nr:hypothetical protein [Actinomycetaceae bacterium]